MDSDKGYEMSMAKSNSCSIPFDPTAVENIILAISDKFDFRVILSNERAKRSLIVTAGLAVAGGLLGRHYGGKIGATVGGAIGGACGLGFVAVSMREIWGEIKAKMHELFEIVYDYVKGMGVEDYKTAAMLLTTSDNTQLAKVLLETASNVLGKKILSNLTAA